MSKSIYAKLSAKIGAENKKIQEKAETRGQQFEKIEYFKPKTGDNMIRLLPNLSDIEKTWVIVRVHFLPTVKKDGGEVNVPVRCLEDFGEKCPACKEWKRLLDEGDKETAKNYRAREQYLYNVLDYTGKKVLPYAMPSKAHETIMSFLEDLGGAAFDLDEGRDWKLTKKVDPSKGRIYGTEYQIKPVMKESAVPEKFREDIDAVKPLDEIYPDTDEEKASVKKRMAKLLGNDVEDDENEEPVKKKSSTKATPAKNKYEDEDEEDEEYVKKTTTTKKSKYVEEDEDEEVVPPPKKAAPKPKAKVEVEDEDLEDEINALLEDDE